MEERIQEIQNKFADEMAQIMYNAGLNGFLAQLYILLFFSEKPLSLDEITDRMKVSKGNVSINIRILENWGAVRPVLVRGSRKDFYEAELNIKRILLSRAKESLTKRFNRTESVLKSFKEALKTVNGRKNGNGAATKIYNDRIKRIEELNNTAMKVLKIANKVFV